MAAKQPAQSGPQTLLLLIDAVGLRKALDLDDDGSLHYQFARALQASGQPDRARTVMAQYQDIVKKNEEQKAEVAREAQIAPPQ